MNEEEVYQLLDRYKKGACTEQENLLVEQWYYQSATAEALPIEQVDFDEIRNSILSNLHSRMEEYDILTHQRSGSNKTLAIAAAVSFLLIAAGAAYWSIYYNQHPVSSPQSLVHDIAPGSSKATLTLANGQQIILDEAGPGNIAQAPGITIKKTGTGQIIYTLTGESTADQINMVTTPKGGQYELVLEDGTKVWLNAGSKLSYPVSFSRLKKREVQLEGEAYFEVTKNPVKPFSVRSTEQLVTVTGTHFDVSCYPEENHQTTLAEGSVVVSSLTTGKSKSLVPGQQTTVTKHEILLKEVNPADVIAWKDGLFVFIRTPLRQVLAQIGRWYNCDIDYNGLPDMHFDGEISRKNALSEVLQTLELSTNIKFKVEGRRIMIK